MREPGNWMVWKEVEGQRIVVYAAEGEGFARIVAQALREMGYLSGVDHALQR